MSTPAFEHELMQGVTEVIPRGPLPQVVGYAPEHKLPPNAVELGIAAFWQTDHEGVKWYQLFSTSHNASQPKIGGRIHGVA